MAKRKAAKGPSPTRQHGRELVLVGDVREAPFRVHERGGAFHPVIALWARAEDGYIVGLQIDEPGHPAQSLVQALFTHPAGPGQQHTSVLPSRVILFNEELAGQVKPLLAPHNIEVVISPRFEPLDDLYAEIFAHLEQAGREWPPPELPVEVMRPLITATERLWRTKPWEYSFDNPPFAIVPKQANARPLYASILGERKEVLGVALYTSLTDYEDTVALGHQTMAPPAEDMSPAALETAANEVLGVLRHRTFLVSFDAKDEASQDYRDQLAEYGWSRRLNAVPIFAMMGEGEEPSALTAEDALEVARGIDSLVTFCQRYRNRISYDEFPIRDTIEVNLAGKTVRVEVSVPGEDPSAPPATVYRFKVNLVDWEDVWRTIEVRSNQTLQDLHYAIQDAFGWDDDHMYAFFLSGKAWDASTEYVRPEGWEPGARSALARLDRLGLRPRKRLLYIFDFGDEWRHEIRVEKVGLPPDGGEYPRIIEIHGQAPPQYRHEAEEEYEEGE